MLILFFCVSGFTQKNYNNRSMVVSTADIENTTYPKDSTANAFYIYEKGYSRVENGGNYNLLTDYERKIKILNKEGYDQAKVEIFLYKNKTKKERARNIVAYTYNLENGEIIRKAISEDNIYTEEYSEHFDIIRFTFPDIKPGCVIRYSYQLESPFIFNFNGWEFQDEIPKMYSEYVSDLPGNYVYNIRLKGPLKLHTEDSSIKKNCLEVARGGYSDCSHNKYTMIDIPAFQEEKYMTAKKNYFSSVEYELKEYKGFDGTNKKYTDTWENVDNELKKENTIGQQLKKINTVKDILPQDIQSSPNSIEKAKKIYQHIIANYTWNTKYNLYRDTDIKKVIKTKTGNVGDINILLHNILKQQGFTVLPVLLSTRTNGYATKIHPVLTDFNYILVQLSIDDTTYLLDATEKKLPFAEIPFRCLNQYGRVLDFKNGSSWIDINPNMRSFYYFTEKMNVQEDGMVNVSANYAYGGYHGHTLRKNLINEQKYIEQIKNRNTDVTVTGIIIQNEEKLDKPVVIDIKYENKIDELENILYLYPFSFPFFKQNPFKLNERTYPVDFGYKDSYFYTVEVKIPENYTFSDIPENLSYMLPNKMGKLSINYRVAEDKLIITHNIQLLSSYYPIDFYPSLKEFFNRIVDIENNTVLTIKKAN